MSEVTRYRFGPRERGRTLAGWRSGQIITVALGLVIGVLILRVQPNPIGVAVALIVLVLCGALATWPVAGRTGEEWLPVAVCWGARRYGSAAGRRSMDSLGGLELLRVGRGDLGVVHDRRARTVTAALAVRGKSFALLGPDEQDRRVGGWSSVLAALAREGSPVSRLQWLAASFPDQGHGAHEFLAANRAESAASAAVASYEDLLADVDADACTHEVVLTVQVRVPKNLDAGCQILQREVTSLSRQLADADVVVQGAMTTEALAQQLLRTYEVRDDLVVSPEDPWPMAMDESWDRLRVDGLWHATFWVSEWPRTEVRSDFLAPLLLNSCRAVLSMVMEPLGPEEALRKVEASRTADLADSELRRRGGFVSTARRSRESEVLARREAELAEGHASFRYAGFVTVSASTSDELDVVCDAVQHAAGQCRLALRRLYGEQAAAYTCTLPLARGLR